MTDKEKLKSIIEDGIIIDIFRVEEAFYLMKEIERNAIKINDNVYGKLFISIQESLKLQIITRTSRIFEKSKNFRIKSIPFVINFINKHKNDLDIYNRSEYIKALKRLNMNVTGLIDLHYTEFNNKCIEHFLEIVPKPNSSNLNELWDSLYKTKWQRDKVFIHNEILDVKNNIAPSYKEILNLIDFAKYFVIAIGWGYTGTPYGTGENWYLDFESKIAERQMNKLLKVAKIIN